MKKITRRQYLVAGAGLMVMGAGASRPAFALDTIRQGFQTNIWGMPTYYLLNRACSKSTGSNSRNSRCLPAI